MCVPAGSVTRTGVSFFNSPNLSKFALSHAYCRRNCCLDLHASTHIVLTSTRIVLSQKCQYPHRPQSKMPVPVSSSVKNASTRIVFSQKCQYPHRPQSKMPVRVSSLDENASTGIVLSRKCQYAYRPQSKMPVCVSSSVKNASTRIVLSRKCQYPYRHTNTDTDTGVTDVQVMAFCQYGHGRIKDRTRIVLVKNASTRTSRPVPAQARCAYGYLHI